MLIGYEEIQSVLVQHGISVKGALHIGAHECEELGFYNRLGMKNEEIVWIDAIPTKVAEAKARGIPNVYQAVVTDADDADIVFNVSNNGQSSSVLEFGTHAQSYPGIVYVERLVQKTTTIDTFMERHGLDASSYDFWNFDIQGAELMALWGATKSLVHAKALYLEINEKELYKGCGLVGDIDAYVATYGFKRVLTNMTDCGWGDALYVKV